MRRKQRGFTLIEMMMVVLILSIVTGVVFSYIIQVQQRYKTEAARLDVQQESREFMDQLVRDMHTAGYPNYHMFNGGGVVPSVNPPNAVAQSPTLAVGLVAVSSSDIYFEGDIAGDGNVHTVRYTLQATGNQCPCTLSRSDQNKVQGGGAYPWDQPTRYATEVQNVVNSIGQANGNVPYIIAGNTPWAGVTMDNFYGTYKVAAIFEYLDKNGNTLVVPPDLANGANRNAGIAAASQVASVNVVLNVLSPKQDLKTGMQPAASMRATVKINNL